MQEVRGGRTPDTKSHIAIAVEGSPEKSTEKSWEKMVWEIGRVEYLGDRSFRYDCVLLP